MLDNNEQCGIIVLRVWSYNNPYDSSKIVLVRWLEPTLFNLIVYIRF